MFNLSSSLKYRGRSTEEDNVSRVKALNLNSSSLTAHDLEDLQSSDPQSVLLISVKDNTQRNWSQTGAQFPTGNTRHSSLTDFVCSYGNKPLVTLGSHKPTENTCIAADDISALRVLYPDMSLQTLRFGHLLLGITFDLSRGYYHVRKPSGDVVIPCVPP